MSTPATTTPTDCLACRLIGTGAFGLFGVLCIASARQQAASPAVRPMRGAGLALRLMGYGFLAAAAYRFTLPMRDGDKQSQRQ